MKILLVLAVLLLSAPAIADQAAYVKLGDIKGEAETVTNTGDEAAGVIDNAEESAEDVKDQIDPPSMEIEAGPAQDYNSSRSNKSDRGKAQDYNSSRSNRRGDEKYLDSDDDDDGVDTEVCNAVDNDCDDDEFGDTKIKEVIRRSE